MSTSRNYLTPLNAFLTGLFLYLLLSHYLAIGWFKLIPTLNPDSFVVKSVIVLVIWILSPGLELLVSWILRLLLRLGLTLHFRVSVGRGWLFMAVWSLISGLFAIWAIGLTHILVVGEINALNVLWMGLVIGFLQHLGSFASFKTTRTYEIVSH